MKFNRKSFLAALSFVGMFFCWLQVQAAVTSIGQLSVAAGVTSIDIWWQKQTLQETEGVVLLRKENSCPANAVDGEEVYSGNGNNFEDASAKENVFYCYVAYVQDASGATSLLRSSGLVSRQTIGEYVWNILQNNLFIVFGLLAIIILAWLNKKHEFSRI